MVSARTSRTISATLPASAKPAPRGRRRPGEVDLDTLPPAGRRILATASGLFYARGIGAVGVEQIALEAGTTKKTIYDRFGSKEGLVTAYLQDRCRTWQHYVTEWLDHAKTTGPDRVLEPLHALDAWMRENDRGCGFVNAYAELAGTGHAGLTVIAGEKRVIRELYAQLLTEAGMDRVQDRATQLSIVHEGFIQQLAAGRHPAAREQAFVLGRLIIDAD
ncbi:MAG TPA: TetR/AcrR family transcriptional regulator [Microlunatus sp.]